LAIPAEEAIEASAKMGIGNRGNSRGHRHTGSGAGTAGGPRRCARWCLIRVFDVYRGVVGYVRVVSGTMEANHAIMLMNNNSRYEIKEVGVFTPKMLPRKS